MGLDQYAWRLKKGEVKENVGLEGDIKQETEEVAYWRKHPNLHGWMDKLYREKGGEGDFNCQFVKLNAYDILSLRNSIEDESLPSTKGFFFGSDADEHYYKEDLEFINNALDSIDNGYDVFYSSWW